jgi:hypothetical protein
MQFKGEPCSLIYSEVMSQILPLKIGYNRVSYSRDERDYFNAGFPPLKGSAPLGLGILCLYFGWISLREDRGTWFHFNLFLVGLVLVGYSFLILLPWSVSR